MRFQYLLQTKYFTLTFDIPDWNCIPAKKYPGYYKGKAR